MGGRLTCRDPHEFTDNPQGIDTLSSKLSTINPQAFPPTVHRLVRLALALRPHGRMVDAKSRGARRCGQDARSRRC
jgi:hypothetical protein